MGKYIWDVSKAGTPSFFKLVLNMFFTQINNYSKNQNTFGLPYLMV